MTVYILYVLHPKMARRESVCNQTPMNNDRGLGGFLQYLGVRGRKSLSFKRCKRGGNRAYARAKFGYGGVR